jgi:hypothetical protein
MGVLKTVAILLLLGGALALFYGGFSYTRDRHTATVGPIELTVKDRETVLVPIWAGLAVLVAGGVMLVVSQKKARGV